MAVLRFLWAVLTSRWLWSLIGIALLGAIVWLFGPLVAIGTARPLAGEIARARRDPRLRPHLARLDHPRPAPRHPRQPALRLRARGAGGQAARPLRRGRRRGRGEVPGDHGRAQAPQARRPALPARHALVRHHRPARLRQDHGAAPVRARVPLRPHRRPAGRRRHAQLRLVLHRDRGPHRHRRPLRPAGEPARGRRRRVARLPRPAQEAPRPHARSTASSSPSPPRSSPRATPRSAPTAARSGSA